MSRLHPSLVRRLHRGLGWRWVNEQTKACLASRSRALPLEALFGHTFSAGCSLGPSHPRWLCPTLFPAGGGKFVGLDLGSLASLLGGLGKLLLP